MKWIFILLVILFALATLMGHSYLQTTVLVLLALALAWWPRYLKQHWSRRENLVFRLILIIVLLGSNFIFFRPGPKTNIYISDELRDDLMKEYDERVGTWPAGTEDIYIDTDFGKVHVLACGSEENPPLVMIHAASMGAHSWAENLAPLSDHYRIYSVDNIGEGNKSQLDNAMVYPETQQQIADHFAQIMDSLGIRRSPLFGASNGGFIAQCFAYQYPERVESLALFGPMGLTPLTGKSFMMLSVATMYPFQFVRDGVTRWALGESDAVIEPYGEWFNLIMRGTIPSVARPVPMNDEQKIQISMPVLLFLGTEDPIVGNAEIASEAARKYPDVRVEIMKSGHLIAVEQAERVNNIVCEFLGI